jgi:hypothetical protein
MTLGVYNKIKLQSKTYALYGFSPVFLLIISFFGNAQNGLTGITYEGYYADNLTFFNTATTQADARFDNIVFTAINTVTPGVNFDDTYSVRFYGYFTATETSVHTFYTESDDASMLWIGNANETFSALETRRTAGNAIVNNSGLHGMQERSGNISLVNGKSYPILVYFGENDGGDAIIVSFAAAGISKTNNGSNHYTSNLRSTPTITNFNNYTKTYFDGSFTIINPTSNSTGAFSYTSNNAAVATISGNTVTITGIGTANITATQAANTTYSSGTATVSLTVSGINVVSKYGGISTTNPNYVDRHGKIGGATGISSNGERVLVKSHELSGLTSATASSSAYAIKQLYPSSTDGLYWIANSNINGGTPFQIYADMTAGGGGWMLLNASGGRVASVQANTVTASTLDSRTYLPNPIVVELAKIATTVQLRSGPIANKTANIATSSDNKPIIALRTGANWYSNNAYLSFITTAGSPYTWGNRGSAGVANGWPSMFHGPCGNCVHWLALHSMGDGGSWDTGEWFSTWIR